MLGVLLILCGYVLGSVPIGLLVGRAFGVDVLKVGSGNIGMANVLRAAGKWPAALTMLGDMLKGFVPVVLAFALHVNLVKTLLALQQEATRTATARHEILVLRRLAVDIEDAFRGYLLTRQQRFLRPMLQAAPKLMEANDQAVNGIIASETAASLTLRRAEAGEAISIESLQRIIDWTDHPLVIEPQRDGKPEVDLFGTPEEEEGGVEDD
jgi:hypothetical protein